MVEHRTILVAHADDVAGDRLIRRPCRADRVVHGLLVMVAVALAFAGGWLSVRASAVRVADDVRSTHRFSCATDVPLERCPEGSYSVGKR